MLIAIACLYLLKYDTILSYFIPLIYIISCTSALSITKIESKFFGEKHGGSEKKKKRKKKKAPVPSQASLDPDILEELREQVFADNSAVLDGMERKRKGKREKDDPPR